MLVNGELGYELDSGLSSLPGRGPEPERDDKLSLPGAGPAKTNKQRDGQRNVEGRSFTLLTVRHLSRNVDVVVVGSGEEVKRKWLYHH